MAKKRGFFAQLEYQRQVDAKNRQQAATAAVKAHAAAVKQADKAHAQASKAASADQKRAEKETQRLYLESRLAEVASMNAQLDQQAEELNSILDSTLEVDDFFDLEVLRAVAVHPSIDRADLEQPLPQPAPVLAPPAPVYVEPPAPKGLGGVLGGKKKHAEAVAQAKSAYETEYAAWQAEASQVPTRQLQQMQEHQQREQQRAELLAQARSKYQAECEEREGAIAAANADLDELIAGLARNDEAAVQEYGEPRVFRTAAYMNAYAATSGAS
jgi:restriction system protein